VQYELTKAGRELAPAVQIVTAWAHKWLEAVPAESVEGGGAAQARQAVG
jgi:DNA-binding HxlR family transcriptional regulator